MLIDNVADKTIRPRRLDSKATGVSYAPHPNSNCLNVIFHIAFAKVQKEAENQTAI
ncbi:Uncharacterised protein [Segatella buccae]|uniref:Uncharacterized protein n=1 Tax=Segatella buccae TaxID=28126 RepID=A0AAQ1ZJ10_9BACT|nr:Uncharacterised protein [Segatella buccae]